MAREYDFLSALRAADKFGELALGLCDGHTHRENMDHLMVHIKLSSIRPEIAYRRQPIAPWVLLTGMSINCQVPLPSTLKAFTRGYCRQNCVTLVLIIMRSLWKTRHNTIPPAQSYCDRLGMRLGNGNIWEFLSQPTDKHDSLNKRRSTKRIWALNRASRDLVRLTYPLVRAPFARKTGRPPQRCINTDARWLLRNPRDRLVSTRDTTGVDFAELRQSRYSKILFAARISTDPQHGSLPLNRPGRLVCDVVDHAVHAADFVAQMNPPAIESLFITAIFTL